MAAWDYPEDLAGPAIAARPVLFLDVDGVISLADVPAHEEAPGAFHWIEGVVHRIDHGVGDRIRRLEEAFDVVWATGWEEQANAYLPGLLGLWADRLPWISFGGRAVFGSADWKVEAIDAYAGSRPAVWIDDNLDPVCLRWAETRRSPTLLVATDPVVGLVDDQVEDALRWASELPGHEARDDAQSWGW